MRKKKNILLVVSICIILPLIGFMYLDNRVKNSQLKYWLTDNSRNYTSYSSVKCNLFSLKYVFIDTYKKNHIEIYFHKIKYKDLFFSNSINWEENYTGGTDIENTTFPELVEMVKEDCSQFQENFDAEDPETQIDWGYREAEPPKTQGELKKEKEEEYYSMYNQYIDFSDEVKNLIRERYGDWENTEYDELLELSLQVAEDEEIGRMANPQWYEMMDQMDEDEEL